jgi:nitroimidazol reductase NimA-like FMN-containing flavoprotein (pyridoxamine 5'-phosphate oxidase superfamily)
VNDEIGRTLSDAECWDLLRSEELGRLAFQLIDEVRIVPINYAVDGQTLLFRTESGEKLLSVALGGPIAFEVDRIDNDDEGEHALSVVIRGRARMLEEDEAHRADLVPLRPWVGTEKYDVVEITPEHLSGRWYRLSRPWRQMIRRDSPPT